MFLRNYLLLHLLIDLRVAPFFTPLGHFLVSIKIILIFIIDHRFLDLILVSLFAFRICIINSFHFLFCVLLHMYPFLFPFYFIAFLAPLYFVGLSQFARPPRLNALFKIPTRLDINTTMTQMPDNCNQH